MDVESSAGLIISSEIRDQLLGQARRELPNECCGLLAGADNRATVILPALNALASPTEFEIAPQELFELFRRLRQERLELVAIYHSHPRGGNVPSQRDRERAYYPDAAYVILSPTADAQTPVRAFQLVDGNWNEVTVQVGG